MGQVQAYSDPQEASLGVGLRVPLLCRSLFVQRALRGEEEGNSPLVTNSVPLLQSMKHPLAQQWKPCPAKHHTFDEL
jgi:hypothetical protein